MKKYIYNIIMCMAVVMTAMPLQLFADTVNATDVSTLDYAVYSPTATAKSGEEITLSVCLKNVNAIATWQADLVLPEGFTIAADSYGDPMITVSGSRTTSSRHSIATSSLASGATRILYSSTSNKTISGTDGEVATITLKVADGVEPGDYPVIFKNEVMSEVNETGHKVEQVISLLTVEDDQEAENCDVNKDGEVNMADVTYIINYLLKKK